ncbi:MAG: 30S ribosomal protein S1 [Nitrospinota bacterium]
MTEDFEKSLSEAAGEEEVSAGPFTSETPSVSPTSETPTPGAPPTESADSQSAATAVIPEDLESVDVETMGKIYEESLQSIKEGQVIKGTVVRIDRDHVVVDVGYKSEGEISLDEFPESGRSLKVGDEVDVFLETKEDAEGRIGLSKEKANRIKVWDKISEAYEKEETVKGTVIARIKGGLTVDVGVRAFLPGSQVDLRPARNLDQYIGQMLEMRIIKMNRNRGNIVLSRRVLLEAERAMLKSKTLETLQEGQMVEGVVKNITDYGAFIDLGGLDGLLHITDMSWGRVGHPSELFKIGDTVKVVVLKFDREKERVSLGHKQITHDPWEDVDVKYPTGTRIPGRVVSITDYGAFVELVEGVEGLVHVSEMTWSRRMRHPSKIVSVGDTVEAVVLNVDKENKRISLGMKQTEENPWLKIQERYPVGATVKGRVRNMTDFGAFLALDEGIDGLIHISDMSWTQRIKHPSDILKKGQVVESVVLNIDVENERLSLGLKQAGENPWDNIEELHHVGEEISASIVKVVNFGAFASLEDGLEGLIHVSELAAEKVERPEDIVAVGEDYKVKIIKIDPEERKLGLSLKAYIAEHGEPEEWKERRARRLEAAAGGEPGPEEPETELPGEPEVSSAEEAEESDVSLESTPEDAGLSEEDSGEKTEP